MPVSHPVVAWQIVAPDPGGLAAFYAKLFGWQIDAGNALAYRQVDTGPGGPPGGIWPASPEGRSFVQLFVAVEDVAGAVDEAERLGARVVVPPTTLPDGDTMAVLADPAGISFGVVQRRAPK